MRYHTITWVNDTEQEKCMPLALDKQITLAQKSNHFQIIIEEIM